MQIELGENALLAPDKLEREDVNAVDEHVADTLCESIDTWASSHHNELSKAKECLCCISGTPSRTNLEAACR